MNSPSRFLLRAVGPVSDRPNEPVATFAHPLAGQRPALLQARVALQRVARDLRARVLGSRRGLPRSEIAGYPLAAIATLALLLLAGCATKPTPPSKPAASAENPPAAPREFRGVWVATVNNIDWPSKKGLTPTQQRAEIKVILDRAKAMRLNAVIFQVRPATDALYASQLEPWSEYITGKQGQPPGYDPLTVWVEEAHARGLELHAWFNPYRARHHEAKSTLAKNHIANTHPDVVKKYGSMLWLDPGEPAAAERTLAVIRDVVRRYDIDGVHIDDYFYPYPVTKPLPPKAPKDAKAEEIDFPDEPSWNHYRKSGGKLARADWRRQNVDQLVEKIYAAVHAEKPWVKFGISPFGLGRPDRRPPGISGFSQYDKLYADAELWLARGWLDYFVPQLYWRIEDKAQSYPVLLAGWVKENTAQRHLWPGLFTSKIDDTKNSWTPENITAQIAATRANPAATGHVHFSAVALTQDRKGIAQKLTALYAAPALIPASPWLGTGVPAEPKLEHVRGRVTAASSSDAVTFAIWQRIGTEWRFSTQPARYNIVQVSPEAEAVVVSAVNRLGNEGPRATLMLSPITK